MRLYRALTLIAALGLGSICGCGGSDTRAEWPDPTVGDRSADDLGLPGPSSAPAETAAEEERVEPPAPPVRVVAGERTPIEGTPPTVRITSPRPGQLIRSGSVSLRLRVRGWELQPAPGQHVHVIVDNEPYIAVRDVSRPLDLGALVHDNLGHDLAEGTHVVRVFPSRAQHESVKTEGAFATVVFHYRSRTEGFSFDPDAPLLTYSRPKGCATTGSRLLLDFYLAHAEIGEGGNRVHYAIDGAVEGEITSWVPHFIENLPAGEHRIRLQLVDSSGQPVPGPFNDTERTIRVAESCD